ncbi:DDE-type integrase/transposase/recombinase [Streptococcus canis]|uniref:DDE-type integrase/transposase/recombinase n=1 Tax=Streptococcus canis TaxID=1329 RepID=UPI0012F34501|nr:hypothetical protein ScFU6_07830 [Streptococcus canis]
MINQCFQAIGKNKLWLGDLTYIPTKVDTLYLSVFIDVYSRKTVGWAMGRHMQASVGNGCFQTSLSYFRTVF